jgi:hypothetical protein
MQPEASNANAATITAMRALAARSPGSNGFLESGDMKAILGLMSGRDATLRSTEYTSRLRARIVTAIVTLS